ncbi:hypothetical protein ACOCJ7_19210 [Knoellia sp. CPCC 206453]|uniref:hypothetical protein n=1 Tax=Knoellia pratensis TaxID=3404796 RepID=UPI0036110155
MTDKMKTWGPEAGAVTKAWRRLPSKTRVQLIGTVLKGERPKDPETWEIMRAWAGRYPLCAVPSALSGVPLLLVVRMLPDLWGDLNWLIITWACFVLVCVVLMVGLSWAVARNRGPIVRVSDVG